MNDRSVSARLSMALAELKAPLEIGQKVSVTDLAKKSGVSRKTIYSDNYSHFLDILVKSTDTETLTSKSATQFEQQISSLSHQLAARDRELRNHKQNQEDLRDEIFSKCFSEIFLSEDLVHLHSASVASELGSIRKQLNNRIEQVKELQARISLLESELDTRNSVNAQNLDEMEWISVPYDKANSEYLKGSTKGWLKSYVSSAKKASQEFAMRALSSNAEITIIGHTFNHIDRERISGKIDSPNSMVFEFVLVAPSIRKLILKPIVSLEKEIRFISHLSKYAAAKWHVRTSKLGVPDEIVSLITKEAIPPNHQEGFTELTIRNV